MLATVTVNDQQILKTIIHKVLSVLNMAKLRLMYMLLPEVKILRSFLTDDTYLSDVCYRYN